MLNIGDNAPEFCLEGINAMGKHIKVSMGDFLEDKKDTIVYFYPRDNTPGCTTEACDFRDALVNRPNMNVVGISKDSVESHKKFQIKHKLNFALLSDPDHKVMEAYGAWGEKNMYGKKSMGTIRSTFIIDSKGLIKSVWYKVKVKEHVQHVVANIA